LSEDKIKSIDLLEPESHIYKVIESILNWHWRCHHNILHVYE